MIDNKTIIEIKKNKCLEELINTLAWYKFNLDYNYSVIYDPILNQIINCKNDDEDDILSNNDNVILDYFFKK